MNYNQSRILDLLKEIDAICRPRQIPFYLAAGSMIGALRHGGFIPWDDDADVYMHRRDWDRFVEAFNENPIPNRKLVDPVRNPESNFFIHRYIDTSTTELYRYHLSSPQQDGIMIDFLILTDIPDTEEEQLEFVKTFTEYSNVLVKATSYGHKCPVPTETVGLRARVAREGRDAVLADYRQRLFSYAEGACNHVMQCDAGVPHVWRSEVFGEPRYVPFEDTEMPVATLVHEALTGAFNEDWMCIPASAEQETHIVTRDYCIGNGVILKDAQQFYDQKEVTQNYVARNWRYIYAAEQIKEVNAERNWFGGEYVRMKYEGHDARAIDGWLEAHDWQALEEYYALYFRYQCSKLHLGSPSYDGWFRAHYPMYIDCGDEFLHGALRTLLHKKQLSAVRRILLARSRTGAPLPPKLAAVSVEVADTNKLLAEFFQGDDGNPGELVAVLQERYPDNPYVREIALLLNAPDDAEQAAALAHGLLGQHPESSVGLMVLGNAQRASGDLEGACATYGALVRSSLDGVVLKMLRESLEPDVGFRANERGSRIYEAVCLSLSGKKPRACELLDQEKRG